MLMSQFQEKCRKEEQTEGRNGRRTDLNSYGPSSHNQKTPKNNTFSAENGPLLIKNLEGQRPIIE